MLYSLDGTIKRVLKITREEGIIPLLKRLLNRFKDFVNITYLIFRIKKLQNHYSLDYLVEFTFLYSKALIKPRQSRFEILRLLETIKKRKPSFILEIGTAMGGSLFLFSRIASTNAVIFSIDLPGGKHGGGYSKLRIPLYKSFALPNQKIFLIRANSHKKESLNKVKRILAGKKLDFLFIDGDHSYEGVKRDYNMYSSLVKNQGLIAFHDIFNIVDKDFKVYKFWNEIKEQYDYEEIVEDRNQVGLGIGILKEKK